MTDPVGNLGRRAQSDPSVRSAIDKAAPKSASPDSAPTGAAAAKPSTHAPGPDALQLSNVSARAMAEPDFDRVKVDAIKQALKEGNYPLNPRLIAESFYAIEQMISE
jgi:negative regulator of flagellin synthesis FlgM